MPAYMSLLAMLNNLLYAPVLGDGGLMIFIIVVLVILGLFFFFALMWVISRYRRCPSNRILVIYGKVGGANKTARCVHGGGKFVWPIIQDFRYLSLDPITIEIDLTSALSKKNIRVNVPSTFTVGISTAGTIMQNAAERLLGLSEGHMADQARDIILGQMRLVIATLAIEEINQDRENFLDLVNKYVNTELNKIGLEVINVNIRDITDESGYIEAIGRRAAAEAINKAKVEVAEQNKIGEIGEATARREQQVSVADQVAQADIGQKAAEREQRIKVAALEAEGVAGEAKSKRDRDIAVAQQEAEATEGEKEAESKQRIAVASYEADAVEGENTSKANIADYEAKLAERQADAKRRGEVAMAEAQRDVLVAQKEQELARLQRDELAQKEIDKKKIEIEAEAEAERIRRIAKGDADAILAKYQAEAEGVQSVLTAKATGYNELMNSVGSNPELAPTLLLVEKMPELVAEQVKAISNMKIDKITVWENGQNENGVNSTANFMRGMIGSLPPLHELAKQAGIDLPDYLGKLDETQLQALADSAKEDKKA